MLKPTSFAAASPAPDSLPVERATITVTSTHGNVSRTPRTDKNGRYTVAFPGDEGDYFVNVAALGFAAKRFEIKRTGDQDILVADARLSRVGDAARRREGAGRPAESRSRDANAPDISGSERASTTADVPAEPARRSRGDGRVDCPACS